MLYMNKYQFFTNTGLCEKRGYRDEMQDTVSIEKYGNSLKVFSVFDGHGYYGMDASKYSDFFLKYLINCAIKKTSSGKILFNDPKSIVELFCDVDLFMKVHSNREDFDFDRSGTTACVVFASQHKTKHHHLEIICANIGDSRCLFWNGKMKTLSEDHKPHNKEEKDRIVASNNYITKQRYKGMTISRINGNLALSRAFGDFEYKKNINCSKYQQAVICIPEIKKITIDIQESIQKRDLHGIFTFIVICCDGVFDVMKNMEVIQFIQSELKYQKDNGVILFDVDKICKHLVTHCIRNLNSTDNVSVVISLL